MMTITATDEEMDFIRKILESPDDDAPRLVFADWLEEQGKDHAAEMLRKQVIYNKSILSKNSRFAAKWFPEDEPNLSSWEKGFNEIIQCSAEWWLQHAAEMLTFHPVRMVRLTTIPILSFGHHREGAYVSLRHNTGIICEFGVKIPFDQHKDNRTWVEQLLHANWPHIEFVFLSENGA